MTDPKTTPAASETMRAIAGAVRFCRFDPAAVAEFDPGLGAAKRSFMAALYCVPFTVAIIALDVSYAKQQPDDLWLYALVQAIAYVIHAAGFPLAMLSLARFLGIAERWPLFVTAQNWLSLPAVAALSICVLLDYSGSFGQQAGALLFLLVQGYVFSVEAFIARVTLGVTALASIAIVLLDFVIGIAVDRIAVTLL
jgi:hypothetical protein